MKAKNFIDMIRKDRQEVWNNHLLALETNNEQGMRIGNPEIWEAKMNETDKEIIQSGIDHGIYIEDADEYLD